MKTKYRQCRITRKHSAGKTVVVSWIPEKYAVVGKFLQLKENDEWVNGYEVELVSENYTENPPDFRKMIRSHRNKTGDSLRKE
jgi:hypothetical protein